MADSSTHPWLAVSIAATILAGLVYVAVQQDLRLSANDPQIQMAQDIAAQLSAGVPVQTLVPLDKVDLNKSLAPFIIIFDDSGSPLGSSAQLDGKTPVPPHGVFNFTRTQGEDRLTWQPKDQVREAAVVERYQNASQSGFVLVGRSLKEVEEREDQTIGLTVLAWVALMLSQIGLALWNRKAPKRKLDS